MTEMSPAAAGFAAAASAGGAAGARGLPARSGIFKNKALACQKKEISSLVWRAGAVARRLSRGFRTEAKGHWGRGFCRGLLGRLKSNLVSKWSQPQPAKANNCRAKYTLTHTSGKFGMLHLMWLSAGNNNGC